MALHFIYLVRHGLAAEQGPEFPNDDDRPLTSDGIERMRVEVIGLRALDVRLDRVLTSPLVRAAQTAEILASGLGCAVPPVTVDALRPGGRYDALLAALAQTGHDRSVALVGHMPSIGEMAARLIGAREPLIFKKGAVCCIETEALPPTDAGRLKWFVTPRALRALGG
ncbi:MAG: phosphohistidine phosphatase SixA [Vicinamibacterales bacterium]